MSPAVADHPEQAELHREVGQRNNRIQKVVVSDSLTGAETAPWTETTTVVRRADAPRDVAELKAQPGGDILTIGSRPVWNAMLAAALGGGIPAFEGRAVPPPRLVDSRGRDDSDNLLLQYQVATVHPGVR